MSKMLRMLLSLILKSMTFWLFDFLTFWLSYFLTFWLSDFLTFCLSDFLTLWLSEFLTFCLSDFLPSPTYYIIIIIIIISIVNAPDQTRPDPCSKIMHTWEKGVMLVILSPPIFWIFRQILGWERDFWRF